MNRKEEIKAVASEKYKDSDFRVPNMYCFIEGAEWADRNPPDCWLSFKERKPEKGQTIILREDDMQFKIASIRLIQYDPLTFPSEPSEYIKWFPVPEI